MSKFPLNLLVVLTLLSLGCQRSERGAERPDRGVLDFSAATVESSRRSPELLKFNGVFTPTRRIVLRSEFSGRLENLTVVKGQVVSRQSFLFTIEDERLFSDLESLRSQLQAAETKLEQTMALADAAARTEEVPEETVVETVAEAPVEEIYSYREPTFSGLAAEVEFTSADAGGIWPGVDPAVVERSNDPQDAGGIWPSYGIREPVTGESYLPSWSAFFAAAAVPMPSNPMQFTAVQNAILTRPTQPVVVSSEVELPAPPEEELRLFQARIDRLRAEIALLENELSSRAISSPLDGRIQELAVSEGSEVQAGDFLVEIYQVNPIELSFQIPKDQVDFLELGMTVKGKISDGSGLAFEGEVSYIGAELNPDQQTVEVRSRIENPDDSLKVGMKADAEVETSPARKPFASN